MVALELQLTDLVLHYVADADYTDQAAVFEHWNVADAAVRHQTHQRVQVIGVVNGVHLRGHDLGDGGFEHSVGVVESSDDVTLGHDPVNCGSVTADDHRTDVVFGELTQQVAHGGVG